MKVLEKRKATATLAEAADDIAQGPVIIMDRGKPVAGLFSLKDSDLETASLSMNPQFLAIIENSRERHKREGGISSAEMRRRLEAERTEIPRKRKAARK